MFVIDSRKHDSCWLGLWLGEWLSGRVEGEREAVEMPIEMEITGRPAFRVVAQNTTSPPRFRPLQLAQHNRPHCQRQVPER